MNEYQQREHDKHIQARRELEPIAAALGWSMEHDEHTGTPAPRSYWITGPDGLEIRASVLWNKPERFEFSASEWPTYTDKNGKTVRVHPGDMGSEWNGDKFEPRETAPTTTAARTREPAAVAKQIKSRVIPEYMRVYAALQEVAASRQEYADKQSDTIARLFEACQEDPSTRQAPYFVRNMPGDTVTVDYRSPGSVMIELSTDDMIAVIAMLRARRQEATT